MTTNIGRAAEVIKEAFETAMSSDTRSTWAYQIAQALADAGLLMPDLPEPSTTPETDPEWANQYRDDWDSEPPIAVWNHKETDWWLSVYADGQTAGGWGEYAEEEFDLLDANKLRVIASLMLAAATKIDQITNHTEQEQSNE